ncbi:uncharacterized protein N7500_000360 [Penicillium coprophilum]|uniref:uncharacterized protein n=1 Tax=Penicillium coprophilum TaxID=36646 RepID=UPI00238DC848|nr:uncharacterized protein N7500_000360 [Penicillium coprophilum]KAJ5177661.1 hypothetical protein N7500_000360 [Penicillium coprophilum]
MARLSNISVVVPLPSFDIDPLKTFDEDFFDRAVDNILSEEASIEESRDEMMDGDIGISSPFGYDGTSDSSKLDVRRSRRTETKSPHSSTTSTSSSPTTNTAKNPKSRRSSSTRKNVTMENLDGDNEAFVGLEDITQPRHERDIVELESYPIHEADKNLLEPTGSPGVSIDDNEMTAEEKIFVSVDPEKQMEVMKFIVSHSFMTEQVQPVQRSARRRFTGQVREVALEAGMNDTSIDALIDHVRNTFLEDREIAPAKYAGSAFGDEVDGEAETRRKRRKSSTDHGEDKEHKKSKRRHSDKPRRHSHDALQHDEPAEVVEAHVPAGVSTKGRDTIYAHLNEQKHKENTPDLPILSADIIGGSPSPHEDPTESPSHEELTSQNPEPEKPVDTKPLKRREPGNKTQREKNRRKRERRRERNKHRNLSVEQRKSQDDAIHSAEKQAEVDSIDGKDRIPPSTPQQTSFEGFDGSRRSSSHPSLPADPTLWDTDF